MASEKDLELLDQYVSNRLAPQDKTAFEKKLESDTPLKNEFTIQKKVVEKLREARVKELKTMFNNVPASALETGGSSVASQVVLWVAVVGALGGGLYLYLNNQDTVEPETKSIAKQEEVIQEAPATTQPQQETPKQESPVVTDENKTSKNTDEEDKTAVPQDSNGVITEEEPKKPAALDVFDPTQDAENSSSGVSKENKTPRESAATKSSIVVEIDSNNKKYNFHYQFKDSRLYLYGTFEKNLYEIMEFFSDNKRTVFLFYKDSYYLLNEESDKIKPLAPINDPTLLKKLKDYRGAR